MKIGGTILLGALIALVVINWLYPLNAGAVALVTALSLGLAGVIVKLVAAIWNRRTK